VRPSAPHEPEPAPFGPRLLLLAFLASAAFWAWQFRGVVFLGQNLTGYHLLDPRITGAEPVQGRRKLNQELPGRDASFQVTHLPYQAFLARGFHRGSFPLWNPGIGCGQPVASDPQYKPYNPFFWPYFFRPSAWLFSVCVALMALWGMWGGILYLRELGLSLVPALLGGLMLAFNPLTQQMLVLSAPWAYWMFLWGLWGAERWSRGRPGGLPLAAAAAALAVFAGHPVVAALYMVVLETYLLLRPEEMSWKERLGGAAAVAGLAALLSAVQWLPFAAEFSRYASYKSAWDGGPRNDWWLLADPKSLIYVPLPVWALAAAGLVQGVRRLRLFFGALVFYGALVMFPWLGNGVARWVLSLGGVLVARYGQEVFWLGLMGLSALGLEALAGTWRQGERWRAVRFFIYGGAWFFVVAYVIEEVHSTLFWPQVYVRLTWLSLLACLPALLLPVVPRSRAWTGAVVAGFLFAVCLPASLPTALDRYLTGRDFTTDPPAIVKAILKDEAAPERSRISGGRYANDYLADLCPNQNLAWGLSDIRITSPIILRGYADFTQHWNTATIYMTTCYLPRQDANLLRFLGVRWTVRDAVRPDPGLPVRRECPPLALQEVPGFEPWVRAVADWEVAANRMDEYRRTFALIESGGWRARAVLDAAPREAVAAGSWTPPAIRWESAETDRYRWAVAGNSGSLLLVLQNWDPNWMARLDGARVQVLRAYATFMALWVPSGDHTVELRYREPSLWAGAAVSLLSWMGLVAWWLRRARWRGVQ
jgi:hypothetical protein